MKTPHTLTALLIVLVVAAIGTYLIVGSHAASPYVSTTADQGTLASGATICPSSSASDGGSVRFTSSVPMDGTAALALSCPGTPFAPTSFWNVPLPAATPANPNNAAYQSDLQYDLCNYYPVEEGTSSQAGYPCVIPSYGAPNSDKFSGPLYVVPANQPHIPVNAACADPKSGTAFTPPAGLEQDVIGNGVPIPADAHGAAGTDEAIIIYQPSTNTEWEFWQFQKGASGNWQACDGAINTNVSGSNGTFSPPFGVSASELALLGSEVRIEELQAGQIDHVMSLILPIRLDKKTAPANACTIVPAHAPCATTGFSWPASSSDGKSTDSTEIAEGQRFRLPANLNLSQYNLTPVARAVAVAAQKYGFIVVDGGGGVAMYFGDPTTYTAAGLPDPYTSGLGVGGINDGNNGLFDGVAPYLIMKNFPWDQLQALPFNYGEPGTS